MADRLRESEEPRERLGQRHPDLAGMLPPWPQGTATAPAAEAPAAPRPVPTADESARPRTRRDGVRLRGGVWYIRLPLGDGRRQEERTEARTRKEAKAIRERRLTEMRQGLYQPDAARTRVAELIDDLARDYRINGRREAEVWQRWAHLKCVLERDLASAVTMPRLTQYVESRQRAGAKPATIQRELACLHRAFTLAFKAGKVFRVPPFPTITVENARDTFFERDELDRLLKELPDNFLRPLAVVAYWVGFRRGELLRLEWRQVDLDVGTIRLGVGTTKNGEGRLVYLPEEAHRALRRWRERTSAVERAKGAIIARVFHRDGRPVDSFPYKAWRAACTAAGCPGKRPHDFRRTMARNYRRSGEAEGVIMRIGGWKTASIFRRYDIVNEEDLRRAAERVRDGANLGRTRNGARTGQVVPVGVTEDAVTA